MAKSIKFKNSIYIDDSAIKNNSITQSDFCTVYNNFSILHSNINKIGNHIFGNLIIQSSADIVTASIVPINIKTLYRPKNGYFSFCGLGTRDYEVEQLGYCYFGAAGDVSVVNFKGNTGMRIIVLEFNYIKNI